MTVQRSLSSDSLTPVTVYKALGGAGCCLLEEGKHSYLGIDPIATFRATGRSITIDRDGNQERFEQDPYEALKEFSRGKRAFGLLSYDAIRVKEKIPSRHASTDLPDFLFHLYRTFIHFDHEQQTVLYRHEGTDQELDALIAKRADLSALGSPKGIQISPDLSNDEFAALVEQAQEFIRAGDIFQIVLSRTFRANIQAPPFEIYRSLRYTSPAPHLFFFEEKEFALAGASPELLISICDGAIESIPIAGTRPKGRAHELLNDPKELAEHTMLVDLARNDVGSIAKSGSVCVKEFQVVRSFSHVEHIVSRVVGELKEGLHALDALKACFPAGTLSGAPKIRAMQLIDDLEHSKRGFYGGAVVHLDEQGNLQSSIAIRMALIRKGSVEVRAGAGVVLDSDGFKEAEETEHKAKGVLEALQLAGAV